MTRCCNSECDDDGDDDVDDDDDDDDDVGDDDNDAFGEWMLMIITNGKDNFLKASLFPLHQFNGTCF